jgi:hypothetical protein
MAESVGEITARVMFDAKQAEMALAQLQKSSGKLTGALNQQTVATKNMREETQAARTAMTGMNRSTANAQLFMTQFAFTVQDVPYFFQNMRMGIMAVSNNIGFLIAQWGQLQHTVTGGTSVFRTLLKTLSGPAGLVVGFSLLIGIVQAASIAMSNNKEEAKEVDEAYKELNATLDALPVERTIQFLGYIHDMLAALEERRQQLISMKPISEDEMKLLKDLGYAQWEINKIIDARKQKLEGQQAELQVLIDFMKEELGYDITALEERQRKWAKLREYMTPYMGTVQLLKREIKDLNGQIEAFQVRTEADRTQFRALVEERAAKQKELNSLTKTQAELDKQAAAAREKARREEEKLTREREKQLKIAEAILDARKKERDEVAAAYDVLFDKTDDFRDRQLSAHEQEKEAIREKYLAEEEDLRKAFDTTGDLDAFNEATAEMKKAREREYRDLEQKWQQEAMNKELARIQSTEQAMLGLAMTLQQAFMLGTDSWLGKLGMALRIIAQIQMVIEKINLMGGLSGAVGGGEGAEGGGGLKGILGMITGFLGPLGGLFSLFGLFQRGGWTGTPRMARATPEGYQGGGYTGPGAPHDIAGFVHRGEVVFERPIAEPNKDFLMGLRGYMQAGMRFAPREMAQPAQQQMNLGPIVRELKKLRTDVHELEVQTPVILESTLSGQTFLRKELPAAERFQKRKKVRS